MTAVQLACLLSVRWRTGDQRLGAGLFRPWLFLFWLSLSGLGLILVLAHRRRQLARLEPTVPADEAWARAWRDVRNRFLTWVRIWNGIIAGACIALIFNIFASWKRFYPKVRPFEWDPALEQLDRWLHGGRHPHEYLASWLASDALTLLMDRAYTSWYLVIGCSMVVWLWRHPSPERHCVILGLVVAKLGLGVLLATLFASAGPCFFGEVTALPDPYAAHLNALAARATELSLEVPATQKTMWAMHAHGRTALYYGISAMPSLHVALPTLFTLAAWRLHRVFALVMALFTIVTMLATVYLGWHYAVDGYVSMAVVIGYWAATRRMRARSRGGEAVAPGPKSLRDGGAVAMAGRPAWGA